MKIKTRGSLMKSLKWFVTVLALAFSSAYVAGSMNFLPLDVKKSSSTKDFQWADLLSKSLENTQKKTGGDELSLSDLVDIALNNNPVLRQAWSTSKASYYDKLASDGTYFPSVTIGNTGTRQKFPETTYTIGRVQSTSQAYYQNSYRPSVAVNYLVWDFGSRSGSVEAAYQTMISQDWTYKWTIQGVLKDVIIAYYEYINAVASLEAKEADLKDSQTSLKASEERHKAGIGTIADVLQAKSDYAKQKMEVTSQWGSVRSTHGNLAISIGLPANSEFKVSSPDKELQAARVFNEVEELITQAKEERADLKAEQAAVSVKEANVKSAKGALFPNLNFNYTLGRTIYHEEANSSTDGTDWTATLSFSVPLFSGGQDYNTYRSSKQMLLAERYNYLNQVESVEYDVLNNYYTLQSALKNLEYSVEYLESAQENYKVALANYEAGTGDILDLLNAQSTLAEARDTRVESKTNWNEGLVNLAYSVGILWLPDADGRIDTLMNES